MGKENKSNNAEFAKRVSIVMEMLLSGLRRCEILEFVRKKDGLNWNVVNSQIDNYIKFANVEIKKIAEKDTEKNYLKAKSRYEFLYRKLINVKDYKGAMSIVEREILLDGLITQQKNITLTTEKKMSVEDVVSIMAEAEKKLEENK